MRRYLLLCLAVCACLLPSVVYAQDNPPPQVAEEIRQGLFNAQVAAMSGDFEAARQGVQDAQQSYQSTLAPQLERTAPEMHQQVVDGFVQAAAAANGQDVPALAAARSRVWTGLLGGASQIVLASVDADDPSTAVQWLPLRDFRTSTRFSRPGADGTLALQAFSSGKLDAAQARNALQADLWDTYQAQLNSALGKSDDAHSHDFALRRAEEAGLAEGYFHILAGAYGEQRGPDSLTTTQAAFSTLVQAAVSGADDSYVEARDQIDTALAGFRAAPLSEADLARRAGQLTRFAALVPVEYARGVRDGAVTNDIEVQEALTFHEGALSAFADVENALKARDAAATGRLGDLLALAEDQIHATAAPADLQATIDEVNGLLTRIIPPAWQTGGGDSDMDVILSVLDQVKKAAAADDYARAESARLEAYALMELGLEQRLRGFAPELAVEIESLFWQGTAEHQGLAVLVGDKAPVADLGVTLSALEARFDEARQVLGVQSAPAAVAGNAAVIVFREGLEAVLILASLLAGLRTLEQRRFRRPLIVGGALAVGASVVTWFAATSLLNVLLPLGETLEAIVSLIAIGVLLLITNWFFHKAYWVGWMANFHQRKQRLVGGVVAISIGQTVGLVLLGFTSIYREGFETVLFLQSLVLEAGTSVVLQGVLLGLLGTAVVGVITFALQVRLPYKKMLVVTGVLIGGVLLTMVGHTVHVIQTLGWLPISAIPGVYLPYWMGQWFGLFATWQGLVLQIAAAGFVIGSYFLAERRTRRHRVQAQAGAAATNQAVL